MPKPHTYQITAVVIKKTRLGEADRILTLYSAEMGKSQGFAKAVRRPNSRLSGHLELLTCARITLARGKNLDTIIGSQTVNAFLPIRTDLEKVSGALYMIDLINHFTPEETADPPLFSLLISCLDNLAGVDDWRLLLRYFEVNTLRCAGYRPELENCTLCRRPAGEIRVMFSPSAGGIICPACQEERPHYGYRLTAGGLVLLRRIQASDWAELNQTSVNSDFLSENQGLLRSYIRYLLEREVKSAAWLEELTAVKPPGN